MSCFHITAASWIKRSFTSTREARRIKTTEVKFTHICFQWRIFTCFVVKISGYFVLVLYIVEQIKDERKRGVWWHDLYIIEDVLFLVVGNWGLYWNLTMTPHQWFLSSFWNPFNKKLQVYIFRYHSTLCNGSTHRFFHVCCIKNPMNSTQYCAWCMSIFGFLFLFSGEEQTPNVVLLFTVLNPQYPITVVSIH